MLQAEVALEVQAFPSTSGAEAKRALAKFYTCINRPRAQTSEGKQAQSYSRWHASPCKPQSSPRSPRLEKTGIAELRCDSTLPLLACRPDGDTNLLAGQAWSLIQPSGTSALFPQLSTEERCLQEGSLTWGSDRPAPALGARHLPLQQFNVEFCSYFTTCSTVLDIIRMAAAVCHISIVFSSVTTVSTRPLVTLGRARISRSCWQSTGHLDLLCPTDWHHRPGSCNSKSLSTGGRKPFETRHRWQLTVVMSEKIV